MEINEVYIKYTCILLTLMLFISSCVTTNKPIDKEVVNNESLSNKKEINKLKSKLLDFENKLLGLESLIKKEQSEKIIEKLDVVSNEDIRFEYQKAFDLIKVGEYLAAEESLSIFIDLYSDTGFIDDAIYWLGESFYSQKKYNKALKEFQKITKEYPNSEKLVEAILKTGFTQFELGDIEKSIKTLNQLIKSYPDSSSSRLAKEKLNSIK
ncbi:MAG: tol-pal system protein YbgF [Gammaproteobacteria bacterium]|nr:tol-pal system protein YbgF [Gammaproteobacteria bacterium]